MKQPSFSGKLTSMLERMRLLVPAALLLLLALLILPQASSSLLASNSPRLQTDDKQVESFISLFIATSDQAVSPGELVSLDLFVTNNGLTPSTPSIHLSIPDVFSIDLTSLPMGISFNVQNNSLDWSPTVPGNGGSSQSRILLRGLVADIKEPEQSITAILRDGDSQREVTSSIWLGVPISARISFSPPTAAVGQSIKLISEVNGPGPVTQLWSLGDGRIVEAYDPEVVYAAPGTYEVILQAANPLGPTTAKSFVEIVSHPIAKFSVSDSAPEIGEPVIFAHTGGGVEPITYQWDFGDGFTSSDPNPIHSYSSPGNYPVRLETHNEFGGSEAYLPVAVGETPISDIVISEEIQAGQVLEARAFFDESTTAIFWDMGDGNAYEGEAINHVYWRSGDFLVKVRVANVFGETLIERWVHVTPGPLFLYLPIVLRGGATEAVAGEVTRSFTEDSVVAENISIPLEELELPVGLTQAEQLLAYINEARRLNGLAELTYAYELSVAAQSHTNDMALNRFTGHEGSDGSPPAWRVGMAGYPSGYAGEATAWGMQRAIEPVQFWLSSPDHRAIMLNPLAGEVGVGFTEDYSAPNIWYWTAEFGSPGLPPVRIELPVTEGTGEEQSETLPTAPATIQLLGPPHDSEFDIGIGNSLIFTWQWTQQLLDNQRFGLYIRANGRTIRIGSIEGSYAEGQYQFSVSTTNVPVPPGTHEWQVRLEEGDSSVTLLESEYWPIRLIENIQPTPTATLPPADAN